MDDHGCDSIEATNQEMVHVFGATAIVCVVIWQFLSDKELLTDSSKPKHLIVARLYHNKKYPTVTELERIAGLNQKTAKKQIDPICRAIPVLLPFL
jgi:hypothetical protein